MSADQAGPWPWQEANWQQVLRLFGQGNLPHALMLAGMEGTGLRSFGRQVAQLLLCEAPLAHGSCGNCASCALLRAGTHPDLRVLEVQGAGSAIKVDAVRELVGFSQETAQQGGYRVALVCPAEAMNLNAANSLLKTLEEPGDRTLLILVSFAPSAVLPTVRSRCQILPMAAPQPAESLIWLRQHVQAAAGLDILHEMAPQQPLSALRLEADLEQLQRTAEAVVSLSAGRGQPLKIAADWMSVETLPLLTWLYQWISGACLAAEHPADAGAGVASQIRQSWTSRAPVSRLLDVLDELVVLRRQWLSGANPNRQLMLERIALLLHKG